MGNLKFSIVMQQQTNTYPNQQIDPREKGYDWIKTECQLTEAQQNTFNLLNTQDNGIN